MISEKDIIPLILERVPSFKGRWERHLSGWHGEPAGTFNDVGQFAHHIVELYASQHLEALGISLALVQTFLVEGTPPVQELASVGILEDIQNIASHRPFGYSVFEPHLGPRSLSQWRTLEATWEGRGSLAEVLAAELGAEATHEDPADAIESASIANPELREIAEKLTRLFGRRGKSGRGD